MIIHQPSQAVVGRSAPASSGRVRRRLILALPLLWGIVVCVVPLAIIIRLSLSRAAQAQPPYRPLFEGIARWPEFLSALTLDNYRLLASDDLYLSVVISSLRIAAIATLLTLLVAYPLSYAIARAGRRTQGLLLLLVMVPFWTSFLIRVYAWLVILKPEGLLNTALLALGLATEPLDLINREEAVILGIVYSYLPFMVLPIYTALERIDPRLLEAAGDLGAPPWRAFLAVTLPLSLPGIFAGMLLVFIPATGEFVIPDLLGGPDTLMIGHVLWVEFFANRDWPLAAALALVLLALACLPAVAAAVLRRHKTP